MLHQAPAQKGGGHLLPSKKKEAPEEEPKSHQPAAQRPHLGFRKVQPIQPRTRRSTVRRRSCRLSEATHAFAYTKEADAGLRGGEQYSTSRPR